MLLSAPGNASDLDRPRQKASLLVRQSLPAELWRRNEEFAAGLKHDVLHHSIARHPAIAALNEGRFAIAQLRSVHLDYRHAIVQVFTDALLAAQLETRQLEPRLPPGAKMPARFLLTLNVLDEFGFRPGTDTDGYYRGTPAQAHYPLFEQVLAELGVGAAEAAAFRPSAEAQETRAFLEAAFGDLALVTVLLAVAEQEVVLFSPPLRRNAAACGIDVSRGYYHVHGTKADEEADASDDDHEDDLWLVATQALEPARYDEAASCARRYCDLWSGFWDRQMLLLDGIARETAA